MFASTPDKLQRITIFPLSGALLFPGLQLPLHIFEPRYRAMVQNVLIRDRQIGMIQPRPLQAHQNVEKPELYDIGCLGKIADVEALEDGRYNIILEGVARFRMVRELDVTTPFRQIEAEIETLPNESEFLSSIERASIEREAKRFAESQGYMVDWAAVGQLDDELLINGIAQVAPFDPSSKQALLEAANLAERTELLVQLMQFYGRMDGSEGISTLQ